MWFHANGRNLLGPTMLRPFAWALRSRGQHSHGINDIVAAVEAELKGRGTLKASYGLSIKSGSRNCEKGVKTRVGTRVKTRVGTRVKAELV